MQSWKSSAESADAVVSRISSGMNVFIHGAAATPTPLLDALARRADLTGVKLWHIHLEGPLAFTAPEHAGRFRSISLFTGAGLREPVAEGRADFVPIFLSDNPLVEFHPCDHTNDTNLIRKIDQVVAINSGLEIDLTGQVCADSIGHRIYSGIGGQMDFVRGAAMSRGGRPIIALPSTAAGGSVSRITAQLKPGAGVVTTRGHVHWVVTEYGAVDLHGRSLAERGKLLASIAHPTHRICCSPPFAISSGGETDHGPLPRPPAWRF